MKQYLRLIVLILSTTAFALACADSTDIDSSTTDDDTTEDNNTDDNNTEEEEDNIVDYILEFDDAQEPNTDVLTTYSPSALSIGYYPITVICNASTTAYATPTTERPATRILPHIPSFTPDYSSANYKRSINRYGSDLNGEKYTATGRFRTEKDANGRWWIIDPDGYRHIQRCATSISDGDANTPYTTHWSSYQDWLGELRTEFEDLGLNGTGAFSSDVYEELQTFGSNNPNTPLTIAPSMGYLSKFRKQYCDKLFPNGADNDDEGGNYEAGLPYYDGWEQFCYDYTKQEVEIYESDPNVLGFFSDNELRWNGYTLNILDIFLDLNDDTNPAYLAAKEFMERNNASTPTTDLREAFAGEAADKYYSGVRKALDDLDYDILYLGSRLHGTPKQIHAVIEAAAKSCDIISINYYNNWSVANSGSLEAQGIDSFVSDSWEQVDAPFLITEFYVKACSETISNSSGAGWLVEDQLSRAFWYQHFTLGLLESTHCVGWHWFRYMDSSATNAGIYNADYEQYEPLARYMKGINYNTYALIDFFDAARN